MSLGGNLIITSLIAKGDIDKTDKLASVMEMLIRLDELNNTDNLEDRRLGNILLRYHVTGSEDFSCFEPVAPQYKKLKNGVFTSLNLRIMDQKGNGITHGLRMTIVLHIT